MNNAALDRVLKCPTLPSLPGVAMEVLELTRDKNVPLRRIAEVVQNDQALAVKILKTVNSSYYGLRKPCPTISRAMAYLGIETVKSLVLGFSLIDVVGKQSAEDFDFVSFWRRCIYGATGARTFATVTRAFDSEEAFIAALLQDVGMLAMRMAMGKEYSDVIAPSARDHNRAVELEREEYGFDHQVAGSALAEKWRLPPQLIETIAHHHRPNSVEGEHRTLVRLVGLANLATQAMDAGAKSSVPARYVEQAREWFRIPADEAIRMLEGISDNARELSRLFHLDTGPKVDTLEIQAMANELLTEHQIEVQEQSRQLRQSNDDLIRRNATDALTGAANRATFDSALADAFQESASGKGPLGVLFIDLDRFKRINDTLGHQAGDAVLVELVKRATKVIGDNGTVARYGGEEFAVILPGIEMRAAVELAERLRAAVAEVPFALRRADDPATSIPVTASVGVACVDDASRHIFTDPARLVHAADKAVYAAKHAGRNCVRVFAVKVVAKTPAATSSPTDAVRAPNAPATRMAETHATATPATAAGRTILLVEDDPLVVALVRSALEGGGDGRVLVAGSGEEAMTMLAGDAAVPDLVVADLHLPGMSGNELARAVRDVPGAASVPVVVMSADESPELAEQSQQAGASAFLPKSQLCDDPRQRILDLCRRWCTSRKVA